MTKANRKSNLPAKPREPDLITPIKDGDVPPLLVELLRRPTPYGSEFRLRDLLPEGYTSFSGNLVYNIGVGSKTLFSCHMDTVHNDSTKLSFLQLAKNSAGLIVGYTSSKKEDKKSVLGADDKVGVYIMLEMMKAEIPGRYIFHVGEEKGCIGSEHILKNHCSELLSDIDRCVAFDRAYYTDIVDYQHSERCCSTTFGDALAKQLNDLIPPESIPDKKTFSPASGVYTDSATYMGVIPECTNISVGYFSQHTNNERFDVDFLVDHLLPAILKVDWEALPTERDPLVSEYEYSGYGYGRVHWPGGSIENTIDMYGSWSRDTINLKKLLVTNHLPTTQARLIIRRRLIEGGLEAAIEEVLDIVHTARDLQDDKEDLATQLGEWNEFFGGADNFDA